jgi:hypothetical protein
LAIISKCIFIEVAFYCPAQAHCTKNLIYVFPEMKLRGLLPNSYSHVSVSDLYIPLIGMPIWQQQNRQTDQDRGRAVSFLRIHKSESGISIGFSPAIRN